MIYTACKSLAKWWRLFLGISHFDLEGWQKYPPAGFCGGAYPPLELKISLKKSHFCVFFYLFLTNYCLPSRASLHTKSDKF